MMKQSKLLFWVLCLAPLVLASGQTQNQRIESEVNEQVWRPFKQSYEERNAKLFNSIHTEDMIRVNKNGIQTGEEYMLKINEWFSREQAAVVTIDFAHEHRYYKKDIGYEVGYFRIKYKVDGRLMNTSYGRFHVRLKKINNVWKIYQDWDTDRIGSEEVTEIFFENATFLNLSNK